MPSARLRYDLVGDTYLPDQDCAGDDRMKKIIV
jgi:hypothetical protein